jgi:hypothetical protein
MDTVQSNGLLDFVSIEHPAYWVRVWVKPQSVVDGPYPVAWNADSYRVSGVVDVHEVLAWAGRLGEWSEVFVEDSEVTPPVLMRIAGFNPARGDGHPPGEFISDATSASKMSALLGEPGA